MNWEKPCYNSSCKPAATERRSKKLTEYHRFSTESLTRIFLTFVFFDAKGILNGFASVAACGCRDKDCRVICYYLVYIYCPKESKCRTLARFV